MGKNEDFIVFDQHVKATATNRALGKYAAPAASHMSAIHNEVLIPFREKRGRIKASGAYTAAGERSELSILVQTMRKELAERRERVRTELGGQISQRRAAAAREPNKEDAVVRYFKQKDIQDHVRKLDLSLVDTAGRPVALLAALNDAIARGVGHDWLDALDAAAVPIVKPEIVAEVRRSLLDGTDSELATLTQLQSAHEYALTLAERVLLDAAAEDGVDVTKIESTAPNAEGLGAYFVSSVQDQS